MSIYFDLGQDSALVLVPGIPSQVNLTVDSYFNCYGLSNYSLTVLFDPAAVQNPSATAVAASGFGAPTVTNNSGSMGLAGSGLSPNYCFQTPASVQFTLLPGATQGATVTIQANALSDYTGNPGLEALLTPIPLRICHASKLWGDVDGNLTVNSRDALIALTAAVGLPVNGFDMSVGDVDNDTVITSRDALFILSAGLGSNTGVRVGKGVADGCPAGAAPAPRFELQANKAVSAAMTRHP
jgi:hypothetical protein